MVTKPYKYQRQGAAKIEDFDGRALLADEMGLGKTLQSLLWRRMHSEIERTVVICPAGLKYNWQREAMVHFNLRTEVLEGTKPPKRRLTTSCPIVIINYDILKAWLPWLVKFDPELVILDEVHYCKNPDAQRTKFAKALCEDAQYVIGLSGTPLTSRPAELYSVLNIINPDEFPESEWPDYAERHCNPKRTPYGWDYRGAARLKELHSRLKDTCMIRRRKKDVLSQLPEKAQHVTLMDVKNRKEYEFARDHLIEWVSSRYGKVRAHRAMRAKAFVKVSYLKRLAARLKFRSVLEWIDNFFEETDQKLVAAVVHKKAAKSLHKRFPNSVVITGDVTGKKRQRAVDKFQEDNNTKLLIGNIQAAGVGLNLTAASTGVFAEMAWTPGEHVQMMDRLHRIGQKRGVQWYWLVARDTIEEKMCSLLQTKMKDIHAVLDGEDGAGDLNVFDLLVEEISKRRIK